MQNLQRTVGSQNPDSMFITDLDGTLLTDHHTITALDLETLTSLQSQHIVTTIATGRSFYSFNKIMAELGFLAPESSLAIDYVIFSTGAGIMDFPSGNILNSFSLAGNDVISVSRYLEMHHIDYMVQKPVPDTNHFIYSAHGSHNPDF
ncbi:MAG: HAD family phosphatase, partial [Proteobacteria bacterium]|nr:HAD family phosphatase [Pseudomonadota bacterium]